MIRVQVVRVVEDEMGNPVVLLRDPETGFELPVWIGEAEAFAIQRELDGLQLPRPMTHDLLRNVLVELGIELMRVEITELQDNTYYATLVLKWNGHTYMFDARPSDSIALALRMKAPIYVSQEVAQSAGYLPKPNQREIERLKRLLKDVELPEA